MSASIDKIKQLSRLRRLVLLGIIILFLLQFLKIKVLVGSLTGSSVLWFLEFLDLFAFFESFVSSRDLTMKALWAIVPVIALYLMVGRAFCGWVCPMDFLYEAVSRLRNKEMGRLLTESGYIIAAIFLFISALIEIPFFTKYISHLTNFFRFLTGTFFLLSNLPIETSIVLYSGITILLLLILEYLFPRLWCRVLCPVGKLYGLFNKFSLIRLKFYEGQCGECKYCEQVCYMKVKLTSHIEKKSLRDTNCIYCGRCVEACNTKGRLIKIGFK